MQHVNSALEFVKQGYARTISNYFWQCRRNQRTLWPGSQFIFKALFVKCWLEASGLHPQPVSGSTDEQLIKRCLVCLPPLCLGSYSVTPLWQVAWPMAPADRNKVCRCWNSHRPFASNISRQMHDRMCRNLRHLWWLLRVLENMLFLAPKQAFSIWSQ